MRGPSEEVLFEISMLLSRFRSLEHIVDLHDNSRQSRGGNCPVEAALSDAAPEIESEGVPLTT
jgi:hypothetical protein